MLPAVLAVFHCFRWYYIYFGLAEEGLTFAILGTIDHDILITRVLSWFGIHGSVASERFVLSWFI